MIKKLLYNPKFKNTFWSLLGKDNYIRFASLPNSAVFISLRKLLFNLGITYPYNSLPTYIAFEINNYCNRKCAYCPNSKYDQRSDKNTVMEESLLQKVIDELSWIGYYRTIYYHLYNEPLSDNRLPAFVEYTRQRLPTATIDIYTNGDYLDYSLFRLLLDKGVNRFLITTHGEKPSPKLSDALIEMTDKEKMVNTIIRNTYDDYINKRDVFFNRGGSIRVNDRPPDSKPCEYVLACNIDVHGNMILCCNDYFGKYIFGNVKNQSLRDIWLDREYTRLRNRIALGYRDLLICKECNI